MTMKSAQRTLAQSLVGKLVRFNHMKEPYGIVLRATHDDMVEIEGHGGYFAPHLFQVVESPPVSAGERHAEV
jgi:hypothetical protein